MVDLGRTGDLQRRACIGLITALVSLCAFFASLLQFAPTPAVAREVDSQITGLTNPWGITIDPADDVWVSQAEEGGGAIAKYGPYPSQSKLCTQTGGGHYEPTYIRSIAVSGLTGYLYVADSGPQQVDVFEGCGAFLPPEWHAGGGWDFVATDNSGGSSNGEVYVALGFNGILAFSSSHNPINFSAAGEPGHYITGNDITGTPSGSFGLLWNIVVDNKGNIYVVDQSRHVVDEFASSGEFVQEFAGAGAPGGFAGELTGVAVDPTSGNVLIVESTGEVVDEFDSSGAFVDQITGTGPTQSTPFGSLHGGIAVNSEGYVYVTDGSNGVVDIFTPNQITPEVTYEAPTHVGHTSGTLTATVGLHGASNVTSCKFEYGTTAVYGHEVPCETEPPSSPPYPTATKVHADISALTPQTAYHYRVVVANSQGVKKAPDQIFIPPAVLELTTGPATELKPEGATLTGSYLGESLDTQYYFQYGTDTSYGQTTPIEDNGAGTGAQTVTPVELSGLQALTIYHYRIVAINTYGTTVGADQEFETTSRPAIDGLSSSDLTATTAILHATIKPNGSDTSCQFELGTTIDYGATIPCEPAELGSAYTDQPATARLTGLNEGVVYHFRVVATNASGTRTSEDQSFNFFPPDCPNRAVRQQTKTSFLPDCRAYELASAEDANGTWILPDGPDSPYADNTFAYGATAGLIPGAGDPENNLSADTYVATRTPTGWQSHFVGIPGDQASNGTTRVTDLTMGRFLAFDAPDDSSVGSGGPYVYNASGQLLGHWPTNLGVVLGGNDFAGSLQPSPDFSHLAFSTQTPFVPNAPSAAPGAAYDFDTTTNTTSLISRNAAGADISQPATNSDPGQTIVFPQARFFSESQTGSQWYPSVSTDGSHILMAVAKFAGSPPAELYMRVADAVTYEVTTNELTGEPAAGNYVGMTSDGAKVFFTSAERLTVEDENASTDLYMWSLAGAENGHPLILVSKSNGERDTTDACAPIRRWTTRCGVVPVNGSHESDNALASASGEIYFYSPRTLVANKGTTGLQNLYRYDGSQLHYVTTFNPEIACDELGTTEHYCANGPVDRIQVAPDGTHMAFVTDQQMTAYQNNAQLEMYTYDPESDVIHCVSCNPNGEPASVNVNTSQNGLFMTDDGRTFFYTKEALVPQDTDQIHDVYEYVDGRAQLITSGTGLADSLIAFTNTGGAGTGERIRSADFIGVSADGVNVFFSTFESLVPQDHNGNFLKIYDARSGGGFFFNAPSPPCEAADECHGPGSVPPPAAPIGTAAGLGMGGNVHSIPSGHRRKSKRKHRHMTIHHSRAARRHGGGGR
jgi:hypothetical protein